MIDLGAVLSDPAGYFATLPERANRELIRRMVDRCRLEHFRDDGTYLSGQRLHFSNGWASHVHWELYNAATEQLHDRNDSLLDFTARGAITNGTIKYYYSGSRGYKGSYDEIGGTITFSLDGKILSGTARNKWNNRVYFHNDELLLFVAPPAIVDQLKEMRSVD